MTRIVEQTFHLVLKRKGNWSLSARLTQKMPALKSDEVALSVAVKVPETLFTKPALRASITVPEGAVSRPIIDAGVVDNIRELVSQQLGVDLTIAVVDAIPEAAVASVNGGTGQ